MADFTKYLYPAIRIEAWDKDDNNITLMDTVDGSSEKNYTITANVSKHLNERIGSFSVKISNANGQFLNTFIGGEDIEIYVDYDNSIDEDLTDDLAHFYNLNNSYKDSVGNSDFVNEYRLYLPFLGTTIDSSGHNNDANQYNCSLTTDRFAAASGAYAFNGTTSYMTHPTNGFESDRGTLFVWFRPNDVSSEQVLYSNSNTFGETLKIGITNDGKVFTEIGDSDRIIGSTTLSIASYYCVYVVYGDSSVTLFLNGYEDTSVVTGITLPTVLDNSHYIGTDGTLTKYFDGDIDDVLYLNTSKGGDNLFDLYVQYAIGNLTVDAGVTLVRLIETDAYYPFDGNVLDSSINARHASINTSLIAHYLMNDNGSTRTILDSKGVYHGNAMDYAENISDNPGKIVRGLTFDGSADYVNLNVNTQVDDFLYHFAASTSNIVNHNFNNRFNYAQVYGTAGNMIDAESITANTVDQNVITFGVGTASYIRQYKDKNYLDVAKSEDYFYEQTTATTAWVVPHYRNDSYPLFQFWDKNYEVVKPIGITINSANQLTAQFGVATTGYAQVIGSAADSMLHTQASATTNWNVVNSLEDFYPFIQCYDASGQPFEPETVHRSTAYSGGAYDIGTYGYSEYGVKYKDSDNLLITTGVSTTGYVRVVSNAYENVSKGLEATDFTYTSWIQPTGTTANAAVMAITDSGNTHKLNIGVSATGYAYVEDDVATYTSATRVDDGSWYHLGFDHDDTTGLWNLYVDNTNVLSSTYAFSISSTDNINLGADIDSGGEAEDFYEGNMDDTRFYSDTLLSEERARIYNSGTGTEAEYLDGPKLATNRFGEADKCYSFDGKEDYFTYVGNFPQTTDNCTYLAWARQTSADLGIIFGNDWFFRTDSGGRIKFDDGVTLYPASSFDPLYTGGASTGWHQVGFMLDGGELYYIQDGVRSASVASGVSLTWSDSNFYMGNSIRLDANWKGELDEIVAVGDTMTTQLIEEFYNYTLVQDWSEPFISGVQNRGFALAGLKDSLNGSITLTANNGAISVWLKDVHQGEDSNYIYSSDVNGGTYIIVNSDNNIDIEINGATIISGQTITDSTYNHIVINWKTVDEIQYAQVYLNNTVITDWVVFS